MTVGLRLVISVAVISNTIVSSTLSGIKMAFRARSSAWNMILTVRLTLLWFSTQTASAVTLSRQRDCRLVTRFGLVKTAPIKVGSCLPLRNIPVGSVIHCIELRPGKGAQMARSAGASVQLVAREGRHATLRLRSGEMRKVLSECRATLGEVSNGEHSLRQLGKAGAKRWRGVRPTVRGVVMNPVDHPHGGGEGRTSGGRHPVSPWGMPTKGYKTRKNKRTDKMIVRRRGK